MNNQLIFPMALYVFYMWLSTVHMFRTRVRAVKAGQVPQKYYKAQIGDAPPEKIVLVGRHYDNQFQVPILFFITCITHMLVGQTNMLTISLAWIFVMSRFIHSRILLGRNILLRRVAVFGFGWMVILALWSQLVYFARADGIFQSPLQFKAENPMSDLFERNSPAEFSQSSDSFSDFFPT